MTRFVHFCHGSCEELSGVAQRPNANALRRAHLSDVGRHTRLQSLLLDELPDLAEHGLHHVFIDRPHHLLSVSFQSGFSDSRAGGYQNSAGSGRRLCWWLRHHQRAMPRVVLRPIVLVLVRHHGIPILHAANFFRVVDEKWLALAHGGGVIREDSPVV